MTEAEGIQFVEEVLQVGWPKWQFTDRDKGEWAKRLWPFDFEKAKKIILQFAFDYKKPGRPPTGQIFAILHKNARLPRDRVNTDVVQLYTIIRPDGRVAGFPVSSARGVPANAEAVQKEAADRCATVDGNRKGFYIEWLCEAVAPSVPF